MGSLRDMPQDKGGKDRIPARDPEEEINPKVCCPDCRWAEVFDESARRTNNADGECRYDTPRMNEKTGFAEWPKFHASQWCRNLEKNKELEEEDSYLEEAERMLLSYTDTHGIVQGRRADYCMRDVMKAANENKDLKDALQSIVWALKRRKKER